MKTKSEQIKEIRDNLDQVYTLINSCISVISNIDDYNLKEIGAKLNLLDILRDINDLNFKLGVDYWNSLWEELEHKPEC